MPANTSPIYTLAANMNPGFCVIGTQNTKNDGAGTIATDIWLLSTVGSNGSLLRSIRFWPTASVAATATAATVLRVYLSTQAAGATTSANTFLIDEFAAAAQTADQTTTACFAHVRQYNLLLKTGWNILLSTHIANAANTAWVASADMGDY
jgi:hypothetical protein